MYTKCIYSLIKLFSDNVKYNFLNIFDTFEIIKKRIKSINRLCKYMLYNINNLIKVY